MRPVVCVGMSTIDLVAVVDALPGADDEGEAKTSLAVVGGPAGRSAIAAARLGAPTQMISMVGTGSFADLLSGLMAVEPLRPQLITDPAFASSQHSLVIVSQGNRRMIVWTGQPAGTESYIEAAIAAITPGTVLLTDCTDIAAHTRIVKAAKEMAATVVVDTGSYRPAADALLAHCDHIVAPEKYLTKRFPHLTTAEAVVQLHDLFNSQITAATRGQQGGIWQQGSTQHAWMAVPVTAFDTCGAGDTFHGAYAFALARGDSPPVALRLAAWAASEKCRALGNDTIPRAADLPAEFKSGMT